MIDLRGTFESSLRCPWRHKVVAIPMFLSVFIPLLAFMLFIGLSGMYPLLREFAALNSEYNSMQSQYLLNPDNMNEENYTGKAINYFGKESARSTYYDDVFSYAKKQGYDGKRFVNVLTSENIVLFLILLALGLFFWVYFSCMANAGIVLLMKKRPLHFRNFIIETNRAFLDYFILGVLLFGLALALLGLFIASFFMMFLIPIVALAIIFMLLYVVVCVVGMFIIFSRFVYATPFLFLEGKGALRSLQESWNLTRGRLKDALIVFAVFVGVHYGMNSLIAHPLYSSFMTSLFDPSGLRMGFSFIVFVVFIVAAAFVYSIQYFFLILSFPAFKGEKQVKL